MSNLNCAGPDQDQPVSDICSCSHEKSLYHGVYDKPFLRHEAEVEDYDMAKLLQRIQGYTDDLR